MAKYLFYLQKIRNFAPQNIFTSMTNTKSLLFDEDAFMRKAAYRLSQKKEGIVNGEEDAFEKVNLNTRVIEHLEVKFLNFLIGKSLPF